MEWIKFDAGEWKSLVQKFWAFDLGRPSETPFLYRGQSNADWQLVDSLSRDLGPGTSLEDALEIEQIAYRRFFAQAHLYLDPSTLPEEKSALGWWALMQHFGCPTRLLDWTASPLSRPILPWLTIGIAMARSGHSTLLLF